MPIFLIAGIIEFVTIASFIFMLESEFDFVILVVILIMLSVLSTTLFLVGIRKNNHYQKNK
ncbi:hypothetical protein CHH48_14225 [Terribacillus saccharophilus]|uniref:Uncharacterized protein n=1 Tax=Terribacillus saccharophilus TaxID=361277 RepID=A0ABX4GVZ5_9BACI|nr:hypothetical protein CHH56_13095 [Terribacillus saccharophilus]PAD95466.1 hypothetical protein CHH50_13330 [Terribacillus saccharophilus]PAD99044.1 hypothetical protein CHH48_14225 [Terribacillus saccharophilus]